jgi:hypothetical protein
MRFLLSGFGYGENRIGRLVLQMLVWDACRMITELSCGSSRVLFHQMLRETIFINHTSYWNRLQIKVYLQLMTSFFGMGVIGVWTQGSMLAKQELYYLRHTASPLCSGYFGDEGSWASCLDWPRAAIFPISASKVARITGVSHQHPVNSWHLSNLNNLTVWSSDDSMFISIFPCGMWILSNW